GPQPQLIAEAVRSAIVPPPRELNPAISKDLAQIIVTALQRRKEARFQSARELQTALTRVLYSLPEIYDSQALSALMAVALPTLSPCDTRIAQGQSVVAPVVRPFPLQLDEKSRSLSPDTFLPSRESEATPKAERQRKSVVVVYGEVEGFAPLRKQLGEAEV